MSSRVGDALLLPRCATQHVLARQRTPTPSSLVRSIYPPPPFPLSRVQAGTCDDKAEKGLVLSRDLLRGGPLLLCPLLVPVSAVLRYPHRTTPATGCQHHAAQGPANAGAHAATRAEQHSRASGAGSVSTGLALRASMPCISRYVAWEISLRSMCTWMPPRKRYQCAGPIPQRNVCNPAGDCEPRRRADARSGAREAWRATNGRPAV